MTFEQQLSSMQMYLEECGTIDIQSTNVMNYQSTSCVYHGWGLRLNCIVQLIPQRILEFFMTWKDHELEWYHMWI